MTSEQVIHRPLPGLWARPGAVDGPYPLRKADARPARRERRRDASTREVLAAINALEPALERAGDAELDRRIDGLSTALIRRGMNRADAVAAFALVREVSRRSLGLRHHDVQLRAGWAMLGGRIAEMNTGEGKTLSATLAAATAALSGVPVHVITVNDYLAARDAEAMAPLYARLGLGVGTALETQTAEQRRTGYRQPVTYCSNKQLVFDFLQDRLTLGQATDATRLKLDRVLGRRGRGEALLLRGLSFAIVDEADSVLIDEARTPMILARERADDARDALFLRALELARALVPGRDFAIDPHARQARLTQRGRSALGRLCAGDPGPWRSERHREQLLALALAALYAYRRDGEYVVKDARVCIVDGYTGRVMGDRAWQGGLQQMIELKEGCATSAERETLARISQQRFFSHYMRLGGMTGTAREVRRELGRVYGLEVERIPPHRPSRRRDLGETVFVDAQTKWRAVTRRVAALHATGQPVLLGTRTVRDSEELSTRLHDAGIAHQVLNARQDAQEAAIIARAGQRGQVTVATSMAGRGTDIALGPDVAALGGLHVIACERGEAARIDRQLFGRAARQGDPGSFERIGALDEELLLELPAAVRRLAAGLTRLSGTGGRLPLRLGTLLCALAQRLAEARRARQRRTVMEADRRMDRSLAFAGKRS
jgi:preprotein translocase subunit SecA